MKSNRHLKTRILYQRLFFYVKPFWPVLALGVLANMLYSSIDAGFTYLMRPFLDKGFIHIDQHFLKKVPVVVLLGITLRGLMSSLGGYCMTWVARSVVKVLRQKVFAHIIHLPADYYDQAPSGALLSKILYDVEQVAQVSADALTDFIQNSCLVIGLLMVMMIINWQLSVVFLFTVPFVGFIVNVTNRRIRRISHKVQQSMAEVTEIASEAIDGYKVVRVFGGETYEIDKFNKAVEISRHNDMKVAMSKVMNVTGVQTVLALGIALIIFVAIKLTAIVTITAGSLIAIIAAMFQLIKPMKTLTTLNVTIQRGLAGAESIFNLLDQAVESTQGKTIDSVKGAIHFNKVSFGYRQDKPVLKDISFCINPGERVAIVGASGSGKTTLVGLLPRFYEILQGNIFIDNYDIQTLSLKSLRQHIALVSQTITLFNDTLANNIVYNQKNVSQDVIEDAARLSFVEEFVEHLPQGYNSYVGENGVLLSGGQRQRLAIARAIIKDAPILILDEATSALDSESEYYIQAALETVMKNRTTLIVAHRLSTIQKADKILVLNKGRLVEQGNHQQLLELNGYYAQMHRLHRAKDAVFEA